MPRGMVEHDQDPNTMALLQDECRKLAEIRKDKEGSEAELTRLNKALDEQSQHLYALMERMGLASVKVDGIGSFFQAVTAFPRVIDEEALFNDLTQRGMEAIIKTTVHSSTLRSAVKEMAEKGEEPLAGIDIYEKHEVRYRRV